VSQILIWADQFYRRWKRWPKYTDGRIPEALDDTWLRVSSALRLGNRGLPGGSSLAQLLQEHRGVRNLANLPLLTDTTILAWADAHHQRTGRWPTAQSGAVADAPGETWASINQALRAGGRGLPGGFTLARLVARGRGVRNRTSLPKLSVRKILAWADLHKRRTGRWPKRHSGPIEDAPGEVWSAIDADLFDGCRGLPGGTSLPQLLAEHRRVRNKGRLPRLTIKQVLEWADAHRRRTGRWPTAESGPVLRASGETWHAVNLALWQGLRGLPGGDSLSQVLQRYRRIAKRKPA
jgi:hypothetical protein